jgi:WD40 repeat protein/DNA-binding SARP family transcriptional activator
VERLLPTPQLQITLLGPVEIRRDGRPVRFAYSQVQSLLIYLVVESERVHQRDVLAGLFWPDQPAAVARVNLRQALSHLRDTLDDRSAATPLLHTSRETIRFAASPAVHVDFVAFRALIAAVEQHKHHDLAQCSRCLGELERALALYRGELLQHTPLAGGYELEEWLLLQREALHQAAFAAMERLADAYERQGAWAAACRVARRMVSCDRWSEEAQRRVMRTLALQGERAAALAQFERCRQILRAELGVEPADETLALATALRAGGMPGAAELVARPAVNPYKGLRAFNETDAGDFFGREDLVAQLLAHLRGPAPQSSFLAVVGPSGSGKSSVVRAGVLPLLRRNGMPGFPHVRIATLTPGAAPLDELAATVQRALPAPVKEAAALVRTDPAVAAPQIAQLLPAHTALVLVIDQFEELFTLTHDAQLRAQVLDLLCALVADPAAHVRVIVTLRADFYDRPLLHPGLGALLRRATLLVLPLSPAELVRAIVQPARQAGVTLHDDLVAAIVQDVGARPGVLPLLQYALTELFERRDGDALTLAMYRAAGGVAGALNMRAEAVYARLDAAGRVVARQLFLRLIALDEGADDLRRRVPLAEFGMADADDPQQPELRRLLRNYGRYRLLTFDRDPRHGAPTVELAHEALIRDWARLRDWCAESRASLRLQRRLAAAATEWLAAGRERSFLAAGARLAQYEALAESAAIWLNADEQAYLEASLHERERLAREERERQERELQAERANVVRLRGLTQGLLMFATLARQQQQAAEEHAQMAQGQALASAAQAAIAEGNLDQARALALAAVQVPRPAPEAEALLAQAAYAPGTQWLFSGHTDAVMGVAFDHTGTLVLSGASDQSLRLWNVAGGQEVRRLAGLPTNLWGVALRADGRYALAAAFDGLIYRWDMQSGALLPCLAGHRAVVTSVAFSPAGDAVLSAAEDGTMKLWDWRSGAVIRTLSGDGGVVRSAVFSADGRQILAGGDDGLLRLWDATTGEVRCCLSGHTGRIQSVALSADGMLAASGSWDGAVRLWDLDTGRERCTISAHGGGVAAIALHAEAGLVASASVNRVYLWETARGKALGCFEEHRDEVFALAFRPDGRSVLSGSRDGTLRLWDLRHGAELRRIGEHLGWIRGVAFSPDERLILSSSWDATARIWDSATGRELRRLEGHTDGVEGVAFSPDGQVALTGCVDGRVRIWRVADGALLHTCTGHATYVWTVAFSPDGSLALSVSHDGTLRLWDPARGAEVGCFVGHQGGVECAAFSADGRSIFSGGVDATLREWNGASGREKRRFVGHEGAVKSVAVSRDGRLLLSGASDGTVRLWDLASGRDLQRFPKQSGPVLAVAFSPDGRTALFAAGLATLSLWDVADGRELRRFDTGGALVYSAVFQADGRAVLAGATDGVIRLWRIDPLPDLLAFVQTQRYVPELSPAQQARFRLDVQK